MKKSELKKRLKKGFDRKKKSSTKIKTTEPPERIGLNKRLRLKKMQNYMPYNVNRTNVSNSNMKLSR